MMYFKKELFYCLLPKMMEYPMRSYANGDFTVLKDESFNLYTHELSIKQAIGGPMVTGPGLPARTRHLSNKFENLLWRDHRSLLP